MQSASSAHGPGVRIRRASVCAAALAAVLSVLVARLARADEPLLVPSPENESGDVAAAAAGDADWMAPCGVCCEDCNRLRFPTSYAWAEALALTRENDATDRALVLDVNTNDRLLAVGDLDFDWTGGLRAGYACREYGCWGLEFAYMGFFDDSASAGVTSSDDLRLPGALGLAVNNFFEADEVNVHYTSELQSGEITLSRSCVGCERSIEWLAGFRYLYFGEGIGIRAFDSAESTTRYNAGTDNNLIGAQIGARGYRRVGRLACEATCKAGLYGNFMEQTQAPIVDFPNFEFRSGQSSDGGDVAFVGDLNLSGIYQLTRVWGLRAGYNVIWIDGVALAADQLDFTNGPRSGSRLVEDGSVFLHGVNAGIEARW